VQARIHRAGSHNPDQRAGHRYPAQANQPIDALYQFYLKRMLLNQVS
jgi:hypothetical protein